MPAGDKPVPDKPPNPDPGLIASNPRRDGGGAGHPDVHYSLHLSSRDIVSSAKDESSFDVTDFQQNPYHGLAAYTREIASFYSGRESQVRDAVQRLSRPGDEPVLLFVTGASGIGKSSFVQAGLLPALEAAYLER